MTSAEACCISKQLASTLFRRQLFGKLFVERWCGLSGNVRLSHTDEFFVRLNKETSDKHTQLKTILPQLFPTSCVHYVA